MPARIVWIHVTWFFKVLFWNSVIFQMFAGAELRAAVPNGVNSALAYYKSRPDFNTAFPEFEDLPSITEWKESRLSGSGYVIHTLQSSLWCLLNTDTYAECVLKAVNLGEDTDTTAAVAGSSAGLWYGQQAIPEEWKHVIVRREFIEDEAAKFAAAAFPEI